MTAAVSYLSAGARRAVAWKNGAGLTREIVRHPVVANPFEFNWRLSVADVTREGPFSRFPGCRRALALLEGTCMTLRFGSGDTDVLRPLEVYEFDGESDVTAELPDGPVRDLNLIYRPASVLASLRFTTRAETWRPQPDETLILINTDRRAGWCTTAERWLRLAPLDAVMSGSGAVLGWPGGSSRAIVRVIRRQPGPA